MHETIVSMLGVCRNVPGESFALMMHLMYEDVCRCLQRAASQDQDARATGAHLHAMAALIAATPYARLETSLLPDALRVGPSLPPHTLTEMILRPCLRTHRGVLSYPVQRELQQLAACFSAAVCNLGHGLQRFIRTCDLWRSIQRTRLNPKVISLKGVT